MPTQLPPDLFIPLTHVAPDLSFRLAVAEDLRPLHAACYGQQPLNRFRLHFQHLLKWQARGQSYWLVVESARPGASALAIVGSGQLVLYPHGAEVASLAVTAGRQGQGIGSAIIEVLLAMARYLGLPGVEIGVAADNERALALYQRLGFVEDRRIGLANGEIAIILYKAL
jgi:ribosomal protein S18 acetylase RimI-like enzyme